MLILLDVNCGNCAHRDHSGLYTPGGAKKICGHTNAALTFSKLPPDEFHVASKTLKDPDNPWHWSHRVIDHKQPEPPPECPLRHGGLYQYGQIDCHGSNK